MTPAATPSDETGGAEVDLCVLGPIRLGAGPAELGGRKQQRVLLRLALDAPSVVSVDRLIDTVWDHRPPSKPEVTLRTYVSHLRRALGKDVDGSLQNGPAIVTRAPGYLLDIDPDRIDVHRFTRLARRTLASATDASPRATRSRADEALALWPSGDLDAGPLADFVAECTELRELRSAVEEVRLRAALELGRHADVLPDLRRLVAEAPLREEPWRLLVVALYRSGRSAEALEAYEKARKTLAEELGLELSPLLAGLDLAILRNDPALTAPTGRTTPIERSGSAGQAVLIGRTEQRRVAERLLDDLQHGRGAVIAVTGEPGIGKTTLVRAIAADAAPDATVAWGHCHDAGQEATLWPWARALRELFEHRSDAELAAALGARATDLSSLLPGLAARLDIASTAARDERTVADAVEAVLGREAARRPVVLVFEDLHWADQPTLDLLDFLAAQVPRLAILVIATWRDTESLGDTAAERLHSLGRRAADARFDLAGLNRDGISELVFAVRRSSPDDAELDLLGGRTAGNPLFLRELLRSPDAGPTATVNEAIDLRLEALASEELAVLQVAALARRPVLATTVATAAGTDAARVELAFERAERAGILGRTDDDGRDAWAFGHALIADRLIERLHERERAAHHAALGRAIEPLGAPAEAIAYHFARGAAAGTAVDGALWSRKAARQSIELHDHPTAERLLHRALQLIGSDGPIGLRVDVLLDLAQVAKFLARYADAHRWSAEAFRAAESSDDVDRMCRAALVFAGHVRAETNRYGTQWLGYWNPAGPSISMLETCIARCEVDDPRHAALTLSLVSQLFGEFADPVRARTEGEQALERARAGGDDLLLTDGLFNLHTALQRSLDAAERAAILDEIDTVAARSGLTERRIDACRARYLAALDAGDRIEANRQIARAKGLAAHSDDYLIKVQHRTMEISDLTLTGRLAEASELVERSFEEFSRIGFASLEVFGIQYATLQRELGALDVVITLLSEREGGYPGPAYGLPLATVLLEAGRIEEAEALLFSYDREEILAAGEGVLQFTMLAFAVDLAVAFGDDDFASRLFEALRPARHRIVAMFDGLVMRGSGSLHLGRLATRLGRFGDAAELLDEALVHHERIGAWPQVMRTRLALAELDAARAGALGLGGPHLEAARELAASFGMSWLVERRVADAERAR